MSIVKCEDHCAWRTRWGTPLCHGENRHVGSNDRRHLAVKDRWLYYIWPMLRCNSGRICCEVMIHQNQRWHGETLSPQPESYEPTQRQKHSCGHGFEASHGE